MKQFIIALLCMSLSPIGLWAEDSEQIEELEATIRQQSAKIDALIATIASLKKKVGNVDSLSNAINLQYGGQCEELAKQNALLQRKIAWIKKEKQESDSLARYYRGMADQIGYLHERIATMYKQLVKTGAYKVDTIGNHLIDGHEYVDLGLPSGLLWATCNLGTSKPEGKGDLYAWGETKPKQKFLYDNYKWKNEVDPPSNKDMQTDTYYLKEEDDAATASWGNAWRMPTSSEWYELYKGCVWKWTDDYNGSGVAGEVGTSISNGRVIFIPYVEARDDEPDDDPRMLGEYWTSSEGFLSSFTGTYFALTKGNRGDEDAPPYTGCAVRAVAKKSVLRLR